MGSSDFGRVTGLKQGTQIVTFVPHKKARKRRFKIVLIFSNSYRVTSLSHADIPLRTVFFPETGVVKTVGF